MGDQIIITEDDKPSRPDVVVIKPKAEDRPEKTEKTVVTESVRVTKTEEN